MRFPALRRFALAAIACAAASCTTAYSYRKNTVVVRNESGAVVFDLIVDIRGDRHTLGTLGNGEDRHITVRPDFGGRVTLTWRTGGGGFASWEGGEIGDYVFHMEYTIRADRVEEEVSVRGRNE